MARRSARSVSESIITLSGSPRYLGVIDYTNTSKTNSQATTTFNTGGLHNKILLVQPSTACYILPVSTSTGTVSSTNGIYLSANERVILTMDDGDSKAPAGELYAWLACIRDASNGNLKVWELV